ncbi:class I SAM-dependent methyltransferase [Flexivirga meconopsidis]|uniref:class I SAM-dependent methyltransferase n=1 Tax=Flexivirga meconopsidis TaxID=2977121 RepID=UPI0022400A91|nr:class I SAM-dependent methyltransferase [Flexivirga meconopsidis]
MVDKSLWMRQVEENPEHSSWYVERFRTMARDGADLDGEARLIDAMAARSARILDAGCGPGRVGAALHRAGHTVVGVDVDPTLIKAAKQDHPGPTWLVQDLATLDLPAAGVAEPFDLVVSAGNVMTFLAPTTRARVLERLAAHLVPGGRAAIGFGAGRGYAFEDFLADADRGGLVADTLLGTWDVRPFGPESDFLVAILRRN